MSIFERGFILFCAGEVVRGITAVRGFRTSCDTDDARVTEGVRVFWNCVFVRGRERE